MQYKIIKFITQCFFLIGINSYCQVYDSTNLTTLNGLPSNEIYSIYKSSKGFIWIGTSNGLCRFNGSSIEVFTTKEGLIGNNIWDITEDLRGNIWVACYSAGLSKFNGKTFENYSTKDGLVNNYIRQLQFDEYNNLLIGTENGLSILEDGKFWNYKEPQRFKRPEFQIMEFFKKNNKQYFLNRNFGFYELNYSKKNKYSVKFISYVNDGFNSIPLKDRMLYVDEFGLHETNNAFPTKENYKESKKLSSNIIWDYAKKNNTVYLASWSVNHDTGGLIKYSDGKIENLNKRYGIESNNVWCIYLDKQNNYLWVGTLDKGLYIINLAEEIGYYRNVELDNKEKLDLIDLEVLNENVFFLTKKELLIKSKLKLVNLHSDFFKTKFRNYENIQKQNLDSTDYFYFKEHIVKNEFKFNSLDVFNERVYVNTSIGIFEISMNGAIKNYYPFKCDSYIIDEKEKLYKPHPYFHYYVYNSLNDITKRKIFKKDKKDTPVDIVKAVRLKGTNYFLSRFKGLFIDKGEKPKSLYKSGDFKELQLNNASKFNDSIFYVSNVDSEIFKINSTGKFRILDTIPSVKIIGKTISFIENYKSYLIIGTEKGVNIFNDKTSRFFDENEGIKNKIFTSSKIINKNLYIGTTKGFYILKLDSLISSKKSKVTNSIKSLKVNYINVDTLANKAKLVLKHDQNTLGFELTNNAIYESDKINSYFSIKNNNWNLIKSNKILLPNLNNGQYDLKIKTLNTNTGQTNIEDLISITILPPFWVTIWFWVLISIIITGITYLVYKYKINKIIEREKLKTQLNKRITETKLEALQSQMNPHFTFNAMSSIQNYIIDSDIDNALMYMGEFSKLIRKTLEYSSHQVISLKDEIEYIESYVKLENMRFDNSIDVIVKVQDILNTDVEEVPPMLIQPLIENAFNHAFIKSEHKHVLNISFSKDKEFLKCVVKDNGSGFNITNQMTVKTKSKGLKIIKERLNLLTNNSSVTLFSVVSTSLGTTTTILIPENQR